MAQRYWSGEIGANPLEDGSGNPAAFTLTGAAAFTQEFTGNSVPAASGLPQTQYVPFTVGKPVELSFLHIPATLLDAVISELSALLPGGGSVACTFEDGIQEIEGNFKPNVPNWITRGEPDGDYVKDAVIRLISV